MSRWLRTAAVVEALHLNRDVQPDHIADFVSRAHEDIGVSIKTTKVILRHQGGTTIDAPLGWWLILGGGFLYVVDNDTFIRQYKAVAD